MKWGGGMGSQRGGIGIISLNVFKIDSKYILRSYRKALAQTTKLNLQILFMSMSLRRLLAVGVALASLATAQFDPDLTGTWTTKSRKVLTGPVGHTVLTV